MTVVGRSAWRQKCATEAEPSGEKESSEDAWRRGGWEEGAAGPRDRCCWSSEDFLRVPSPSRWIRSKCASEPASNITYISFNHIVVIALGTSFCRSMPPQT